MSDKFEIGNIVSLRKNVTAEILRKTNYIFEKKEMSNCIYRICEIYKDKKGNYTSLLINFLFHQSIEDFRPYRDSWYISPRFIKKAELNEDIKIKIALYDL